jgi:hypothetical protein
VSDVAQEASAQPQVCFLFRHLNNQRRGTCFVFKKNHNFGMAARLPLGHRAEDFSLRDHAQVSIGDHHKGPTIVTGNNFGTLP